MWHFCVHSFLCVLLFLIKFFEYWQWFFVFSQLNLYKLYWFWSISPGLQGFLVRNPDKLRIAGVKIYKKQPTEDLEAYWSIIIIRLALHYCCITINIPYQKQWKNELWWQKLSYPISKVGDIDQNKRFAKSTAFFHQWTFIVPA